MTGSAPTSSLPLDECHDETLVDWFVTLAPAERLAELESRLEFFAAALIEEKRALGRDKDQAALRLLEGATGLVPASVLRCNT